MDRSLFYIGFGWGIASTIVIGVFIVLLTSCAEPPRMFNNDEQQDLECYGKFGGMRGYCDKGVIRK